MIDEKTWKEAISTNMVDGLEPSDYLKKLIEENIKGNITSEEIIEKLKEYYEERKDWSIYW